ncbi:DUF1902 domain-containing protein [Sphingomonas bacterium]|uniref:DUF1902 domain-containing protein n=1 Tax=Sphingomonas bacterium TaxID=1895847 RepID=UPI001576F38B|nr:DUF1902 domain-containing protein [Sphingomonas bacterium]
MNLWNIRANYDPESRTWYTLDGDIPGLLADAATIEELALKAGGMLPDLLEIHGGDFHDKTRLRGPHRIHVIAFHERDFDVAA